MANLRFLVRYKRTVLGNSCVQEVVERDLYAAGWDAAERVVTTLPRYVETLVVQRLLPETAAEMKARIARENSGPVPYGC